ncbi:MAG: hypothetical protein IIX74_04155 [Lachnospiraceae bacterium]|nr:hypothetical protein [Lachnospiraceae bacterium]
MKKYLVMCLLSLCVLMLAACGKEEEIQPSEKQEVTFEAAVLEVHDGYCLVKPSDGSQERKSADKIEVSMKNMDSSLEPEVGDSIEITYDGMIMEIYPARLHEVYNIKIVKESENKEEPTLAQTESTLASTEEELDQKVAEIILEHNKPMFTGEECQAEGHIILEHEEQDGVTTVYALMMYGEYQFQNVDYLIKAAGTGVIPVVLSFGEHEDGREFTHMTWPEDGSGYNESIKEMFPEHLWDRVLIIQEADRALLTAMERAYAEEHLKMTGRDAVIGDYADVERTILTDHGISVDVSNKLFAYEEKLAPYPSWHGTLEKVEDGERYLYSVFYDEETNQIIYEKRFFGTNETVEKFVYDAETGELVN